MYSGSLMGAVQKFAFNWGPSERALQSNISDACDVVMPLVMDEFLQISPPIGKSALRWGSR
jgi:hypothetical protein